MDCSTCRGITMPSGGFGHGRPPAGMGFVVTQEQRCPRCGQHWMWDGTWHAISRLKYERLQEERWAREEAERVKEEQARLDRQHAIFGYEQTIYTVEQNHPLEIAKLQQHGGKDYQKFGGEFDLVEFENRNYCPWHEDWPEETPFSVHHVPELEAYVFKWDSPFDGMLDGKPTHHSVMVPVMHLLKTTSSARVDALNKKTRI